MIDCAVIGAGQAGLATSFHLSRLGVEHVVLERGRVGESWRMARWDSFHLNTPNWCTQLPGMAARPADPDAFSSLEEIIETLDVYAREIDAPVHTGDASALRTTPDGFALALEGDVLEARSVVVATGAFQQSMHLPAADDTPAAIAQMHTAAYRAPTDLPEGGVLVVGSGQSGCEIALELLETGRPVHLALGRCGWAPRRHRGRELMRWMVDIGAMDETPGVLPTPRARLAGNVAVSGSNGGRDCNALVVERAGGRLYGRFERFDGGRARFAGDLEDAIAFGSTFQRDLCKRWDDYADAAGLDLPPAAPAEPRPTRTHDPTELDLAAEGVSTVLWAGGFRPAFAWIDLPIFDEFGFPRARRGVTDVSGLSFVGLPWLHTRKSPLLLGVGEDAEFVAQATATHLERTG